MIQPPFPPRPPKVAWLVFGVVLYLLLAMGYFLYSSYWQNGLFGLFAVIYYLSWKKHGRSN